MQNEKNAVWVILRLRGSEKSLRGRITEASLLPEIWCQFQNAREIRQKCSWKVAPCRKRKFRIRPFYNFQIYWFSATRTKRGKNKLISLQTGKEIPKNARHQKNALRIKNILEGYQNNRIKLALDGLSNNFDFV